MRSAKEINKHVFPETIIKSREVLISNGFLLVLHSRFSSATKASLCNNNWHNFNVKPKHSASTLTWLQKRIISSQMEVNIQV